MDMARGRQSSRLSRCSGGSIADAALNSYTLTQPPAAPYTAPNTLTLCRVHYPGLSALATQPRHVFRRPRQRLATLLTVTPS